jgi:hypothetical protein
MKRLPTGFSPFLFLAILLLSELAIQSLGSEGTGSRSTSVYLNSQDVAFLEGLSIPELLQLIPLCELPVPLGHWDVRFLTKRLLAANKTIDPHNSDELSESILPWLKWALMELRLGQDQAGNLLSSLMENTLSSTSGNSAGGTTNHVPGLARQRQLWREKQARCLDPHSIHTCIHARSFCGRA